MTTQSPNQSLTPRTDAIFKSIATAILKHKKGEVYDCDLAVWLQQEAMHCRAIERELNALTPSPAPSKEMEERIEKLVRPLFNGSQVISIDDVRWALRNLAAELGKERGADKEKYIQSALARDKKADEEQDALESIIESLKTQCALRSAGHDDLRTRLNQANQQISQLKRELAEAESVIMATRQASIEAFNRIRVLVGAPIEGTLSCEVIVAQKLKELHAQNLALSSSYQRQKEALDLALRAGDPEEAWEPIAKAIQDALAETPDVSLWQPIESAPKCKDYEFNGPRIMGWHPNWNDMHVLKWSPGRPFPHWTTDSGAVVSEAPTLWQPLPPPPTLQPDHQK